MSTVLLCGVCENKYEIVWKVSKLIKIQNLDPDLDHDQKLVSSFLTPAQHIGLC